jgi:hypothetical protein
VLLTAQRSESYYGFGKNKIHYLTYDWSELDFGSHIIYYPTGFDRLGRFAAHVIETEVGAVEDLLGHTPRYKIPIILYNSHFAFLETNVIPWLLPEGVAGFTEFIKGRVVVPNTGSYHELRHVLVHEMTHALMKDRLAWESKTHRRMRQPYVPLWFWEGLAEYTSTSWTDQEEMILGDVFLENMIPDVSDLWHLNGSYLVYVTGHSLLTYMAETLGPSIVNELLGSMWRSDDFEEALLVATGYSSPQLSKAWKDWIGRKFAYLYDRCEADLLYTAATPPGRAYLSPAVTGTREDTLVCLSYGDGYASIYALAMDDRKRHTQRLIKAGLKEGFESLHLFRSSLGAGPNGQVTFVAKAGERDALYVMDVRTAEIRATLTFPSILAMESPSFSRDGSMLAFCGMDTLGAVDLYVYHSDSGQLERLTDDIFRDASPSFSPTGDRVVFCSDRTPGGLDGGTNLFELDLKTRTVTQVTCGTARDTDPVWSPRGDLIAFVTDRGGGSSIWVANGEIMWEAIAVKGGASEPAWNADGTALYFSVYRRGTYRIFLAEAEALVGTEIELARDDCGGFWEEPLPRMGTIPQKYRARYSLDLSQGTMSFDPALRGGGADILLTDVLGDRRISLHISNTAEVAEDFLSSFNLGASYTSLQSRLNYGVSVFRLSVVDETPVYGVSSAERHTGAAFALRYPLSRFHRIEEGTSIRFAEGLDGRRRTGTELHTEVGYVRDTAVWGSEGPWDGARISMKGVGTLDLGTGRLRRHELFVDLRRYYRLSLRSTWANRLQWWSSDGTHPRRFGLGGAWSLRGWGHKRMIGRKRFLMNSEVRFPIVHSVSLRSPIGHIGLGPLRGALFVDAGSAWDGRFSGLVGSYGIGLRLTLGGLLVLRYDIATPTDFRSRLSGTVKQFFFGWSY